MEIMDNRVNKRIISGSFPEEILSPDADYSPNAYNLEKLAENGLKVFEQYPELMYAFFMIFNQRVKEIELMNRPELFSQEINVLINTGYSVNDLSAMGEAYHDAYKLCPAVTSVDKVLWYGAWGYYFSNQVASDDEHYKERQDMMFTWIYLLKLVQDKEVQYNRAINVKSISSKTNILKLIRADWNKVDRKYFLKLTEYGIKKLREVNEAANQCAQKVRVENAFQKDIADKTNMQWQLFLNIFNDLSKRERDTISLINHAGSPKDKSRIINRYNSVLRGIERGKYEMNEEEISLIPLFEAVNERMTKAPVYCTVRAGKNKGFQLNPAAFMLTMNPKTFNYLLITFHEFRLTPSKDTARKFMPLILSTIKKNLGVELIDHVSVDDIIEDFYLTITSFVKKYAEPIGRLSFEKIQNDYSAVLFPADIDGVTEDLAKRIKEIECSEQYEEEIERIITGNGGVISINDISSILKSEEEKIEQVEQEVLANRIIVSLNIIYMFCEALRIMLINHHSNVKFKNREEVEKYRIELLKIEDSLVHKVYSSLGEQEMGMLEYREKYGINATSLTEQEMEEEGYRNALFGEVLKSSISSLIEDIEKQNPEQILQKKALIRTEILRFPDCDEKERYTEWLDTISQRLSEVLINNFRKDDDYQKIKDGILSSLGGEAHILPESTVDSLATAEMLYARYASEKYAEKGFDFSCISALYYQAFEEAYNVLIWKGYANELNNLEINGQKYTEILEACKGHVINQYDARGYLDQNPKQRNYYIEYRNASRPETKVSTRCMYKSFAILLQNIKPSTTLTHFCEYIAKISGFNNTNDMFCDSEFMRNCYAFAIAVDASADNRNNASHGGTFISVEQCKIDKKTVLNELEAVRSDSLGLIQQLFFLLEK